MSLSRESSLLPSFEQLERRLLFSGSGFHELLSQPSVTGVFTAGGVGGYAGGSEGAYRGRQDGYVIGYRASGDDRGNSLATASRVQLSENGGLRLLSSVNYVGDIDVFEMVAPKSGRMRIRQNGMAAGGQPTCVLRVYDVSGRLLAGSSPGADGTAGLEVTVAAGRTYYLSVEGVGGTAGLYLLRILPTLTTDFTAATEVTVPAVGSTSLTGTLGGGQSHAYCFTAPARGWYTVEMRADGSELQPHLQAYDGYGRALTRGANMYVERTTGRVRLFARAGASFYVVASDARGEGGGYRLTFTGRPVDDYGNTFVSAEAIEINQAGAGWLAGKIQYGRDIDVFRLVAARSGTMTVNMQPRGRRNSLDGELTVYDAGGAVLTTGAAAGEGADPRDAEVSFEVAAGRTYYLAATGENLSTGMYFLRISTREDRAVPQPDDQVVIEVVDGGGGAELFVFGTNEDDSVTIRQEGGRITVTTAGGSEVFVSSLTNIIVYGFGGADVIRITNGVTISSWIYGGDGDDMLFAAATAVERLYGEAGDDLLVSLGGGADRLYGGGGVDSFWLDGLDVLGDASTVEIAAGYVHRIDEFYQPYSDDPNDEEYIPLEIAGQNFTDPALTSYACGYANFASTPVFVDGPEYDDIVQGSVGDCYYLAALASLAETDPSIIEQMIAPLGDGTYAVRFYNGGEEIYLRIDADLPVSSSSHLVYAKTGPDDELWVPLLEKAYAYFRYGQNSYASINGGWMSTVYHQVTGQASRFLWMQGSEESLYNYLAESLAEGHAVTVGSYYDSPSPIVGSHAYVIKSVEIVDGQRYVTVFNPWGTDGRAWDSNYSDGLLRISVSQVQQSFSAAVICMA